MSLSVLVVCTGNICRSPLAEQVLAARLQAAGVEATVTSAGTHAMVGEAMNPESAVLSQRFGGRAPEAHVARQLTAEMAASADLILAASREHRAAVASLLPSAARKSYTLREFARIAEFLENEPVPFGETPSSDLLEEVSASRGFAPRAASPEGDDIVDPYRRSAAVYEEAGALVDETTAVIARAIAASRGAEKRGPA